MNITDSLGLDSEVRDTEVDMRNEKIDKAISIIAIKGRIHTDQKFECRHINPAEVMAPIEALKEENHVRAI